MYWNSFISLSFFCIVMLNSNIRCIEILLEAEHGIAGFGWIVTLDVLKCI